MLARKGVLDELLLNRAEVVPHRFFRELRIPLGDCACDLTMCGRVARLIVDAMRRLAPVSPIAIRRNMHHCIENRQQHGIARRYRDPPVKGSIRFLVGQRLFRRAARIRCLEQFVEIRLGAA